jgi:hypothetical protein
MDRLKHIQFLAAPEHISEEERILIIKKFANDTYDLYDKLLDVLIKQVINDTTNFDISTLRVINSHGKNYETLFTDSHINIIIHIHRILNKNRVEPRVLIEILEKKLKELNLTEQQYLYFDEFFFRSIVYVTGDSADMFLSKHLENLNLTIEDPSDSSKPLLIKPLDEVPLKKRYKFKKGMDWTKEEMDDLMLKA